MSVEAVTVTNEDAARRRIGATAALAALVMLLMLISLGIGPVRLSPLAVAEALIGGGSEVSQVIVREIRLPRTLLALAIGAILGLSGAALRFVAMSGSGVFGPDATGGGFSIGRSVNEKVTIFCGLPSSRISKSSCVRFRTKRPSLSVTKTSTSMRRTSDRKVGCAF